MYDLISVGNISIDLYYQGKSITQDKDRFNLAIGGKYYADYFYENIGGGGCNVAAGVAKLGLRVAVFGKVGNNPFKDVIFKKLTDKKISTEFCEVEDDYFKISSILLTDKGERTIIHYETPTPMLKKFFLHNQLKRARNIYFSPMEHLGLVEKKKMIKYLKGDNTLTFVNLPGLDCKRPIGQLKDIFDSLDVLIINAHEYSLLVRKNYKDINFKKLKITLPYLNKRVVVITDAERGSYGYTNEQIYFQEAIKPKKIIDTTGAGDAYTAGFIAQYIKSGNVESSMLAGTKYASSKLTRIGAN
jgi:sugar/nucleoside kinase (ribokinase family)